jgi:hypothetical protein
MVGRWTSCARLIAGLALYWGCSEPAKVDCGESASSAQQPLTNAASAPHYLRLATEEIAAVVHVRAVDPISGMSSTCTGTFIRDAWVLTAGHCAGSGASSLEVDQVDAEGAALHSWAGVELLKHPELDLMLLRVEGEGAIPFVPIATSQPQAPHLLGERVQLAGTGQSNEGPIGVRRFSVTTVVEVTDDALWVSADGYGGACDGDSGGPLLVRGADGSPEIAGVLSSGNVTCFGRDQYVPTSLAAEWLAKLAGPAPEPLLACGEVDEEGGCFGDVAAYCRDGVLVGTRCTGDLRCGWSVAELGFRCVRPEKDPCRGVAELGRCNAGEALACVDGRLRHNACVACGAACVISPRSGAASCVL